MISKALEKHKIALCFSMILLCVLGGSATPIPTFDLSELVRTADLIVVGIPNYPHEISREMRSVANVNQEFQRMQASVNIIRTLKGDHPANTVTVEYLLPLKYSAGYRGLTPSNCAILFLNSQTSGTYSFASPYYPSLPAIPVAALQRNDVLFAIVSEVTNVIASSEAEWQARRKAMFYMSNVSESPELVTSSLRKALASHDERVSVYAAAFLLLRNDTGGLALAAKALSNPERLRLRDDDYSTLLAGIDHGIHSPLAPDALKGLLESPDARTRAAVARGIGNSGATASYPMLRKSLADADVSVRYSVCKALANLFDQPDWEPMSLQQFAQNEQKYVQHWENK